jgi:hypothetical protein
MVRLHFLDIVWLNEWIIIELYTKYNSRHVDKTGLIEAACEPKRTVTMLSNGHAKLPNGIYNNGHSQILKPHQNGNGFISSNGSLKGVFANGNGVYVDGSC